MINIVRYTGDFAIYEVRYIEVFLHSLHYYWDDKYRTLYRGLRYIEVRYISRFFSIHYTITGMINIVRSTEDFAI